MLGLLFTSARAGYLVGLKIGKNTTFAEIDGYCHRPKDFYQWLNPLKIKRHFYGDQCKAVSCDYLDNNNICNVLKEAKAKKTKCEYL